jgi:hypothetical protein
MPAPIIRSDYPQAAPESPGGLFDGIEIDGLPSLPTDLGSDSAPLHELVAALLAAGDSSAHRLKDPRWSCCARASAARGRSTCSWANRCRGSAPCFQAEAACPYPLAPAPLQGSGGGGPHPIVTAPYPPSSIAHASGTLPASARQGRLPPDLTWPPRDKTQRYSVYWRELHRRPTSVGF